MSDLVSTAPAPADTGTTISFGTAAAWRAGDWADIPATGEQILVHSGTANPYTIVRGHNETAAAAITTSHRALKRPRYGTKQIEEAIQRVADRLYPDIWEVTSTTITYSATANTYALPAGFLEAIDLTQAVAGTVTDTVSLGGWAVVRDPAGTGWRIRITNWARIDAVARLVYRAIPSTATTDTQLQHIMALGTAEELLLGEAAEKADRKDEVDRHVRILRSARLLRDDFDRAMFAYRAQQVARYGYTRRFVRAGRTFGGV